MLRLIRVSFLINIMEKRNVALMVLLPLFLTLLLGAALESVFDSENDTVMLGSTWLYYIEDSEGGDRLRDFLDEYGHQFNMDLTWEEDKYEALDVVAERQADAYLVYADGTITIYQNEHANQATRWLKVVFDSYLMRVAIIDDIVENTTDMSLLQFIQDTAMSVGEHVSLMQIDTISRPDAIGYYAIAMITLTSSYSMVALILALNAEKRRATAKRYLTAGKSLFSFVFSKSISMNLVFLTQLVVIMLFNTFIYGVYFGAPRTWLTVLAVTMVFAFAITQLASMLCLLFKNLTALVVAINTAVLPIMLFFGGAYLGYHRLIDVGLGDFIIYSPVYHLNKGIFDAIYLDSTEYIMQFTLIVAVVAVFLIACNFILSKWRGNSWMQ